MEKNSFLEERKKKMWSRIPFMFNFGTIIFNGEEFHRRKSKYTLKGGKFMYIVKDTQPDVAFQLSFQVLDAEGSPVIDPAVLSALKVEVVSDNPSSVAVIADPDGNPLKGTVTFGSPNTDGTPSNANINITVSETDGTVIGVFGAQFTVTAGDPAAIASGTIVFAGLSETSTAKK
jgi:hypothetical protein